MKLEIPYGDRTLAVDADESRMDIRVVRPPELVESRGWTSVVGEAMASPVGARRIREEDLTGKRVAIITDDWGRPTPAYEVIPSILDALAETGVADDDITFVTASGMHDPMEREDLVRKLGEDVVARYRCVSHDGGDHDTLRFIGVSDLGTPVFVNRHVVEADYVIGLGRVYLHVTHGYEGGYKLILPGVAGFETILRDHAMNFSPDSVPGIHENPSRTETDAVGAMVGIDFLINVVVNSDAEPLKAFAGAVGPVYHNAVAYGDRHVWGGQIGHLVNIAIVSHGSSEVPGRGFDPEAVRRACSITQPGGTVIVVGTADFDTLPDWRAGEMADDAALEGLDRDAFGGRLRSLAFSELMRLHERRDWPLSPREIQWRMKAIRGEYYRRRWLMSAEACHVAFTLDPQTGLEAALARHGGRPRVLVIPEGRATLPKISLHRTQR